MKIAVASEGKDVDSEVSDMGGRAPYYIIFEEGKLLEIIKNPFAMGSGGAGPAVAYMLAEKGVRKVIAQKIGPKMMSALRGRNLKFEEHSGKISKLFKSK